MCLPVESSGCTTVVHYTVSSANYYSNKSDGDGRGLETDVISSLYSVGFAIFYGTYIS